MAVFTPNVRMVYGEGMRAITYRRVSTDQQAESGAGLDAQAATVAKALEARGWEHVGDFCDEGASAKNLNRPALAEALAALDAGEADALVVAKLDRLSRSVSDFASVAEQARRKGWALVLLDVDVDTSTPTGELVTNISASVSQWERRIIGARTAEALAARKAKGVRLGRPAQLEGWVRERIVAERADGRTLAAIADALTEDGAPTAQGGARWYPSTVSKVLKGVQVDAEANRAMVVALDEDGLDAGEIAEKLNSSGRRTRSGSEWSAIHVRYELAEANKAA